MITLAGSEMARERRRDRPGQVYLLFRGLLPASLGVMAAGFFVLIVYCVAEWAATPGSSLVDAYWRGRLPWMGIAEGLIVSGATSSGLIATGAVLVAGGSMRRALVLTALLPVALWWFLAIGPYPGGALCVPSPCPPQPVDPWAYAYSAPEFALLFLIVPSLVLAILALTARGPRAGQADDISPWAGD